jgi:hypothetical protein
MSISSIQSSIERIQREIESLHRQQTDEMRKEASKTERIAQVSQSITRTTSASTILIKQREIQGLEREIISCQKRRADLAKRVADKTGELHRQQQSLFKEQERERKSLMDSIQRRDRELKAERDSILNRLASRVETAHHPATVGAGTTSSRSYDAFISHATEDKDAVARPLAERLLELGFEVWYDEFQLRVGDSLRRSIDRGLANSRFGIVVLSPAFFAKNWPQYELDGLVAREMMGGKVILPLWHKLSKDEVMAYSPSLADKLALNTASYSIEELARELAEVLRA